MRGRTVADVVNIFFGCRVDNYDTWRPLYEEAMKTMPGVLSWHVFRSADDPNRVFMHETFESREQLEEILGSDELQAELVAHGVDPASVQYWLVDEAAEGGS